MDKKYRGVFHLNKPPVDKIGAHAVLERTQGEEIEIVGFWNKVKCPKGQLDKWESEGILPIDLDEDKYHFFANDVGSATEFILKFIISQQSPAEARLVEMFGMNNAVLEKWKNFKRGGYLKVTHMSIPWTLRKLYEIGFDQREVVRRTIHVIRAWLDVEDKIGLAKDRDDTGLARFGDLLEETSLCRYKDFTPQRYLKDLWRLGYSEADIQSRVRWWIAGWKLVKAAEATAEDELKKLDRSLTDSVGPFRVYYLETDNTFLSGLLVDKVDVAIVKSSLGHTSLMVHGLGQMNLADELLRMEPGRWYYQEASGTLINGGLIYTGEEPTLFGKSELMQLLRQFPPRRRPKAEPRRMQHGVRR